MDCKKCPNEGHCDAEKIKAFEQAFADCKECRFSKLKKDGTRMCLVKSIDCSVREGRMPCTKYEAIE